MILHPKCALLEMDADLRGLQEEFDAAAMTGILAHEGVVLPPMLPPYPGRPMQHEVRRVVAQAFADNRGDLGCSFADIVDFADHFGFSVEVLDEDAPHWRSPFERGLEL